MPLKTLEGEEGHRDDAPTGRSELRRPPISPSPRPVQLLDEKQQRWKKVMKARSRRTTQQLSALENQPPAAHEKHHDAS